MLSSCSDHVGVPILPPSLSCNDNNEMMLIITFPSVMAYFVIILFVYIYIGSLYVHNKEVDVDIFDITGVTLGLKVSLRCRECSTNYNYSYYSCKGVKNHYPQKTKLIEISDVTFATRRLHKWYIALRYMYIFLASI